MFSNKFISACKNGDINKIKCLLNENKHRFDDESPLFVVFSIGNKKIVELIIKHGAKSDITVAYKNGHRHLFEVLISHGANVSMGSSS